MRAEAPRRVVASVMLVALTLSLPGCMDAVIAPPERPGPDPRTFTGAELYRGLVLAAGPVADLIPEIRDNLAASQRIKDPAQLALITDVQDQLVEAVGRTDPAFFDAFAAEIRSGDRLRISQAMRAAADVTLRAVTRTPEAVALRERMATDPAVRQQLQELLLSTHEYQQLGPEEREQLSALVFASLAEGRLPEPSPRGVVLFVIAGAVFIVSVAVIATTIAGVLNYAVAGQIYYAAAVTQTKVGGGSSGGGGGCSLAPPRRDAATPREDMFAPPCELPYNVTPLLFEQLVNSTALTFAR